jgi:hypothetical protein
MEPLPVCGFNREGVEVPCVVSRSGYARGIVVGPVCPRHQHGVSRGQREPDLDALEDPERRMSNDRGGWLSAPPHATTGSSQVARSGRSNSTSVQCIHAKADVAVRLSRTSW